MTSSFELINSNRSEDTHSHNGVVVGEGLGGVDRPHVWRRGSGGSCDTMVDTMVGHDGWSHKDALASMSGCGADAVWATYVSCWWREGGWRDPSGTMPWSRPGTPGWAGAWKNCVGRGRGSKDMQLVYVEELTWHQTAEKQTKSQGLTKALPFSICFSIFVLNTHVTFCCEQQNTDSNHCFIKLFANPISNCVY